MKEYIILGYPLNHTISPLIHNKAFNYYSIKAEYKVFPISPEEFSKLDTNFFRNSNFIGGNITVPYKEKIINFLDSISEKAGNLGAVNTFFKKDGALYGDNTDYYGFLKSLDGYQNYIKNKTVVILGTGGSSKAVFHALITLNPEKIIMVSRDKSSAEIFVLNKKNFLINSSTKLIPFSYDELEQFNLEEIDTIINTTPIGMYENKMAIKDFILSGMKKNSFVYDLIYNPEKTKLLKTAENYGMEILNGKKMLIYQAEKAFELWTGYLYPEELLKLFL